jgi:hypothetical protein
MFRNEGNEKISFRQKQKCESFLIFGNFLFCRDFLIKQKLLTQQNISVWVGVKLEPSQFFRKFLRKKFWLRAGLHRIKTSHSEILKRIGPFLSEKFSKKQRNFSFRENFSLRKSFSLRNFPKNRKASAFLFLVEEIFLIAFISRHFNLVGVPLQISAFAEKVVPIGKMQ